MLLLFSAPEFRMAHIKLVPRDNGFMRCVYFIDAAVGQGRANRREDVLLVQFFLRAMWAQENEPGDKQTIGVPGKPPLAVDGVVGPDTIAAIQRFQSLYHGGKLSDGAVDVVPPGQSVGPLRGLPYTMIGLNTMYAGYFGKERHLLICDEPDFPLELRLKFYVS
jgi:hypothetical protein